PCPNTKGISTNDRKTVYNSDDPCGRHALRRSSCGRGGVMPKLSHGLPDLYGAVNAGGGDGSAVGRPGQGSDVTGMAQVGRNGIARDGVPDVDSFVATGGSEIAVVR